jgi:CheY-like chemotaxis protein
MDQDSGTTRILLIDDEAAVLDVTRGALERMGYEVTAVSSGVEALDLFSNDPDCFDLIITDMVMPRMTGVALARQILEIRLDMPVILYSGLIEEMTDEQARSIGIRGLLKKPSMVKELAAAVSRALDLKTGSISKTPAHP